MQAVLFTTIILLAGLLLCLNSIAQTPENKPIISKKVEQEKREIESFFYEFVRNLEKTQDLNQVSEKFFAPNFKMRFTQNEDWFSGIVDKDLFAKLNDSERYESNISLNNFFYLLIMSYFDKNGSLEKFGFNEEDFNKALPPHILEKLKKSKWLQHLINDQAKEINPVTIEDLQSYLTEMNSISADLRKYLNSRSAKQKSQYTVNYKKWLKSADDESLYSDICEGKNCMGLPEKSQIFALHAFPLCLRIAKINGELKIVNIYSVIAES